MSTSFPARRAGPEERVSTRRCHVLDGQVGPALARRSRQRVERARAPRRSRAASRAGWRCAAGAASSCGAPAATAGRDRRCSQTDTPWSAIIRPVRLGQEGPAAGRQHAGRTPQQPRRSPRSPGRGRTASPSRSKISAMVPVGGAYDLVVRIEERDAQQPRQRGADRGLARPHHADQHHRLLQPPRSPCARPPQSLCAFAT